MKIVYFDYWTKGINLFTNIDKQLKALGHDTMLFHTGSVKNKYAFPEETINGILCRDISYYQTKYLLEALKQIKPDIVLSVNSTYILDRALILACRKLNIKTVYLMNGKKPVGKEIDNWGKSFANKNRLMRKIIKSIKYLKLDIPNYFFALYHYNPINLFNCNAFRVLYDYFKNPNVVVKFPIFPDELLHNKCLVFGNVYINHWINVGYSEHQIHVTGNQELDKIFTTKYNIVSLPNDIQQICKMKIDYAVYLEEANVEHMVPGWTDNYRNDHLTEIANRLEKDKQKLIVKLHPLTSRSNIKLNSSNVILIKHCDLPTLIYFSNCCISHMSTTADYAILLDKPLIIPYWGLSTEMIDYFISKKVGKKWCDINDDLDLSIDALSRKHYIEEYITITDGSSLSKIVHNIINV